MAKYVLGSGSGVCRCVDNPYVHKTICHRYVEVRQDSGPLQVLSRLVFVDHDRLGKEHFACTAGKAAGGGGYSQAINDVVHCNFNQHIIVQTMG